MGKEALLLKMLIEYNNLSFTSNYILGFQYKKNVYMAYTDVYTLARMLRLSKASRGQGMSLRYMPATAAKIALLSHASLLCSVEFFESQVNNSKYNKGEVFEKLVFEFHGQEWTKDNVPFTDGPDIEIYETPYQIKFEKSTLTNERTLWARVSAHGEKQEEKESP